MDVLALVDLALPQSISTSPEQCVEGIAKSCLLLQTVQQCKASLAYNTTCAAKMDSSGELLEHISRGNFLLGKYQPLHSEHVLKDAARRLDKWRCSEKRQKVTGNASVGNVLSQMDRHLDEAWTYRADTNKWVLCFTTFTPWNETQFPIRDTHKLSNLCNPETNRHAFIVWVECDPSKAEALRSARQQLQALKPGKAFARRRWGSFTGDYQPSSLADKYTDFLAFVRSCFAEQAGRGSGDPLSCCVREGLPPVQRLVLLTMEELVDRDKMPSDLYQLLFTARLEDKQFHTLQGDVSHPLADVWPKRDDNLHTVCSKLRIYDKRFWDQEADDLQNQPPQAQAQGQGQGQLRGQGPALGQTSRPQGPALASQPPLLQSAGSGGLGARLAGKGNQGMAAAGGANAEPAVKGGAAAPPLLNKGADRGPNLNLNLSAKPPKQGLAPLPVPAPSGVRPGLPGMRINKLKQHLAAAAAAVAAKQTDMGPPAASGIGKASKRPPVAPQPLKPDPDADALSAVQEAESVHEQYMSQLQPQLEALTVPQQAAWFPDWEELHRAAQAAAGAAIDTLTRCSQYSVKVALHFTRKQRPGKKAKRAQGAKLRRPALGPVAAPAVVKQAARKRKSTEETGAEAEHLGAAAAGTKAGVVLGQEAVGADPAGCAAEPPAALAAKRQPMHVDDGQGGKGRQVEGLVLTVATVGTTPVVAEAAEGAEDLEEGEESNGEAPPALEKELLTRTTKKDVWTLLDKRWFHHSATDIYARSLRSPAATPCCTAKLRLARLAYCSYLYMHVVHLLDWQQDRASALKHYTTHLRGSLEEMEFLTAPLGGHRVVWEQHFAPKFADRLPKLLENLAKDFNGELVSDPDPDNRISGYTGDGDSDGSTFSDANCGGGGRLQRAGSGIKAAGGNKTTGGRGQTDNASAGSRPPSSGTFPAVSRLEEVDSAFKGSKGGAGRVAPAAKAQGYLRSRVPGLDKWRPNVLMEGKPAAVADRAVGGAQAPRAPAPANQAAVAKLGPAGAPAAQARAGEGLFGNGGGIAAAGDQAVHDSPPDRLATGKRLDMDMVLGSPQELGPTPIDQAKAYCRAEGLVALGLVERLEDSLGPGLLEGGREQGPADFGSSWLVPAGRKTQKQVGAVGSQGQQQQGLGQGQLPQQRAPGFASVAGAALPASQQPFVALQATQAAAAPAGVARVGSLLPSQAAPQGVMAVRWSAVWPTGACGGG